MRDTKKEEKRQKKKTRAIFYLRRKTSVAHDKQNWFNNPVRLNNKEIRIHHNDGGGGGGVFLFCT